MNISGGNDSSSRLTLLKGIKEWSSAWMCVCWVETSRCSCDPAHSWRRKRKLLCSQKVSRAQSRLGNRSEALWRSGNIKTLENKASRFPPCCCCFSNSVCVSVADGDGYQDHLLPVCLDPTCQHSAVYLSKMGSKEVKHTWSLTVFLMDFYS